MSRESRMLGGILLVVLPTVMYGGLTLLSLLTRNLPGYNDNPLRHDLWRAGHAHAGVYLVLSLVMHHYVDEAVLSPFWMWLARSGTPIAAILIPAAFFLPLASPTAKEPNGLINLAYVGALFLAARRFKPRSGYDSRRPAHASLTSTVVSPLVPAEASRPTQQESRERTHQEAHSGRAKWMHQPK